MFIRMTNAFVMALLIRLLLFVRECMTVSDVIYHSM